MHQPSALHRTRDIFLACLAKLPLPQQVASSNRVLVIRPDHLGDVLLMRPALQFIKRQRPQIELHVICGAWAAQALVGCAEVNVALTLDFPGFQRQRAARTRNPYLLALDSARKLRRVGYDSALIMRPDHWWGAMLAYLAGISQRVGYAHASGAPFLTRHMRHQQEHAVLQNLHLAQFWLGADDAEHEGNIDLTMAVDATATAAVEQLHSEQLISAEQPIVCIHPGSGMTSKLWQPRKWAQVADDITGQRAAAVIFTGSRAEQALVDDIASQMQAKSYSVAGKTSVSQLAALYRRASLVLGVDSGAMHIAAAAGCPTVTLFGPADPIEFAPWGDAHKHQTVTATIACRPCRILDWGDDALENHPCVRDISVSQVLVAAQRALAASSGGDSGSQVLI